MWNLTNENTETSRTSVSESEQQNQSSSYWVSVLDCVWAGNSSGCFYQFSCLMLIILLKVSPLLFRLWASVTQFSRQNDFMALLKDGRRENTTEPQLLSEPRAAVKLFTEGDIISSFLSPLDSLGFDRQSLTKDKIIFVWKSSPGPVNRIRTSQFNFRDWEEEGDLLSPPPHSQVSRSISWMEVCVPVSDPMRERCESGQSWNMCLMSSVLQGKW